MINFFLYNINHWKYNECQVENNLFYLDYVKMLSVKNVKKKVKNFKKK